MQASPAFSNFTAGELSPLLDGRVAVERYHSGARALKNFMVHPEGPAYFRPGTRYVAEVKDSSKRVALVPFVFNESQSYLLEFGDGYIRFYTDHGQVLDGSAAYDIASPYSESQLGRIKVAQSADTMYIAHPEVAPQKLTRSGHTSWAIGAVGFGSAPSKWTGSNYPRAVAFFEQRLWWAGTPNEPMTLWASVMGDYENLNKGDGADDDALEYTINSQKVTPIMWLLPHEILVVGTTEAIWGAGARSSLEAITPTNVQFKRIATEGSAQNQGHLIGSAVIYVSRSTKRVNEQAYELETDGPRVKHITLLGRHLSAPGLTDLDWAQEPNPTLWAVTAQGKLLAGTYYPPEDVLGWTPQETPGEFESAAVIPAPGRDELWVAVKRTVNGQTRRYIEYMEEPLPLVDGDVKDSFHLDSGLTYQGAATDTLTGLSHLDGEEVAVLAEGAVHPNCTVSGGQISLAYQVSQAHVGLPYSGQLQTMRVEAGRADGTAQGKRKRIHSVTVRFLNTVGGRVGVRLANMATVNFREVGHAMDTAIPLFSGDKEVDVAGDWGTDGWVYVTQDEPLPMTVVAIYPNLVTSEG